MRKKLLRFITPLMCIISLLINSFTPFLSVQITYAEEATPSSEVSVAPIEQPIIITEITPYSGAIPDATPIPEITSDADSSVTVASEPSDWNDNGDGTWQTIDNVVVNKEYVAKQNDKVRIKFSQLPTPSGKITIKEIKLSSEQIEQTGALSDTAYDISSTMENGTFEYTLMLPTTKTDNVEVKASEDGQTFFTLGGVSAQAGALTITGLNHFTVFVVASPDAGADISGIGTVTWSNPIRVKASDGSHASVTLDGKTSHYLKATDYGLSIPPSAVIKGIVISIERKSNRTDNGGSKDAAVRLIKNGIVGTTDRSTSTTYTTANDFYENHGSPTDLWGETWTAADLNSSNFGVAFAATKPSSLGYAHIISVDHIKVTVYYNTPPVANEISYSTDEDAAKTITLAATDVDSGDSLTYSIVSEPSYGTLGLVSGNSVTYTPAADYNGSDSFIYKANDGTEDSNSSTVNITVNAVNDVPLFDPITNQSVDENASLQSISITNVVSGSLDELSQSVTMSATSSDPTIVPDPSVSGGGLTRTLNYTPATNKYGVVTITVTADDGQLQNNTASRTFTITVNADVIEPSGGSISYTDGYYTTASVALTVEDGIDSGSGINSSSRIIKRKSATLSNGTCGIFDSWSMISPAGSYPNFSDTDVSSGNCYQYQYSVSDNEANQATYTSSNTAKVDTTLPTILSYALDNNIISPNSSPGILDSATIDTAFSEKVNANISIFDASNQLIKSLYTSSGTVQNPTAKNWDGKDASDNYVSDGVYTIKITITDIAGNATIDTSKTITVDNTSPTNPGVPISNQTNPTNQNVLGWNWAAATDTLSDIGSYVWSLLNGETEVASGSTSPITPIVSQTTDISSYLDGIFTFKVKAGDNAGNFADWVLSDLLTVDRLIPVAPIISTSSQRVDTDTIQIIGTTEDGSTVTITGGESTVTGIATGGNFEITVTLTHNTVNDLSVTAKDAAGNESLAATVAITHDDTSPTVTILGDGASDYSLPSLGDGRSGTTLIFSEELNSTSKTAIEDALTAGTNKTLTFRWGTGDISNKLRISVTGSETATFANDVVISSVSDLIGNSTVNLLLVDSKLESTQTAPDSSGNATSSSSAPQVVITNPTQPVDVVIDSGTTDPSVDISSLIAGGTGLIPQITINSGIADIAIPSTTVTGPSDWDGVIAAPTVTTVTLPSDSTLGEAIEIGYAADKLSFDNAVRILMQGQAGKKVGYSRPGTMFTEITNVCSADNQASGDALVADGECKIDVGSDMVIWTKHFTKFASYTQTTNSSGGGSSSSSGGDGLSDGLGCANHDCNTRLLANLQGQVSGSSVGSAEAILGTTSTGGEASTSSESSSSTLGAEFTPSPSPIGEVKGAQTVASNYWWLLFFGAGGLIVLFWFFRRKPSEIN